MKPKVILHSWWPDFKEFPDLDKNKANLIFTKIPDFDSLSIRNNDVNIIDPKGMVLIQEDPEKDNLFVISFNDKELLEETMDSIELEVWFDIGDITIMINKDHCITNSTFNWTNIKNEYTYKDDRILIQKTKLKIKK
jgi:hypothetical protein